MEQRKTFVIAECGSCHDGKVDLAIALINEAAQAGASCAKFQYYSSASRLAARRNAPILAPAYEKYALPRHWLGLLREQCDRKDLKFACTVFLPEDVWAVAEHCDYLKVASFEAEDRELLTMLRAPFAAGKHIIISLGMGASASPAHRWLLGDIFGPKGTAEFLHCVSAYPAPADQLTLSRIAAGARLGFSDHSPSTEHWSGAIAVAAGARTIERHLRLESTTSKNPDYPHSMDPAGFANYVANIRRVESMLGEAHFFGDGPGPQPCEADMLAYRVAAP